MSSPPAAVHPAAPRFTRLWPLLIGVPDSGTVKVVLQGNGEIGYVYTGNARIATDLAPDVKRQLVRVLLGPDIPLAIPPALLAQPCINTIADADLSGIALHMLEQHLETHAAACFNHPGAVLNSTRERVADSLSGLDGIHMPRTLRLRIDEPTDLARAVEQNDLGWPVIVRLAGSHRGESTVRVDKPEDVHAALRQLPWGGHDLYLTEYIDCRDADGLYRKLRLAVVGGEAYMRHQVIAHDWMVHVGDRRPAYLEEEQRLLGEFDTTLKPALAARVRAVAETLDLDYFGIDCSVRPDGRLLIFEANVLMDILINTMPLPNCWETPIAHIREALTGLLSDPARWRHPSREIAPA